jgi:hypothetical protein
MKHALGWSRHLERQHDFAIREMVRPLCAVAAGDLPKRVSLRHLMRPEPQGEVGQCAGAAVSLAAQGDIMLREGGGDSPGLVDLSMTFSWLAGRKKDGTSEREGIDTGTSISGVCLAARDIGMVLESDCPTCRNDQEFRARGGGKISGDLLERAKYRRLRAVAPIKTCEEGVHAMGSGQGFIVFGVEWNQDWARDRQHTIERLPRGQVYGGHAIAAMGYDTTHSGKRYWDIWNHHGEQWGDRGCCMVMEPVIDQLLRGNVFGEAMVVSISENFEVRPRSTWRGVM